MTPAEKSLRRTLQYTETSPDPTKTCSDCEFFQLATDAAGCGSCEMFGGKQANSGGHCVSWSVDPKDVT
ncbi:MAG: high-potential iron-sulfur protein [Sphingomonadales bacterium]